MSDSRKPAKATLTETEISTAPSFGRRALLLGTFGATAGLAGCVVAGTGITDADTGAYADPAGGGRGTRTTGITDSDIGAYSDPVGNGRGRRVCTDGDLGYYADPVNRGRRC